DARVLVLDLAMESLAPRHDPGAVEALGGGEHVLELGRVVDEDDLRLAVLEEVAHLLRRLVRVDAEAHRPRELRAEIVDGPRRLRRAEHRDALAGRDAEPAQAGRHARGRVVDLGPAPASPRAVLARVERRARRAARRAQPEHLPDGARAG